MVKLILYVHFNEILLRVNDLLNLKVTALEVLERLCSLKSGIRSIQ